ncbi:hypothetical protein [Prosthecobacter sp.]|uniref:hypothetical protein n=1 Tax=Prosthecobacter sp. TaxID=1965333 RepID=UPI0037831A93
MMRRVLILLALCGCVLPAGGGPAPKQPAAGVVAIPNNNNGDFGISTAAFDPKDIQILSARYARTNALTCDLKPLLARRAAENGFVVLEVSDRLCRDVLSSSPAGQSLAAALGGTSGTGVPIASPWVDGSVAAELSEDRGTLTVTYLYRGQPRQKKADYGSLLLLP